MLPARRAGRARSVVCVRWGVCVWHRAWVVAGASAARVVVPSRWQFLSSEVPGSNSNECVPQPSALRQAHAALSAARQQMSGAEEYTGERGIVHEAHYATSHSTLMRETAPRGRLHTCPPHNAPEMDCGSQQSSVTLTRGATVATWRRVSRCPRPPAARWG